MKKNEEKILKYLSHLMSDDERILFEEELIKSADLKKEFHDIGLKLSNIRNESELEVNDLYFANLVPRINQRLAKNKRFRRIANFYYLVPAAAAIVIVFLFLFNSKKSFEDQYKELADEVVSNFADKEVSEKYINELESDPVAAVLTNDTNELNVQLPSDIEISNDSYVRLIGNPITEEFSTLQKLSGEDLEKVYNKLNLLPSQKVLK